MCVVGMKDEVAFLKNADAIMRQIFKDARKLEFSPKVESFARDLLAVEDALNDACLHLLKTEDEQAEDSRQEKLEKTHLMQIQSDYFCGQMGIM